MLEYYYINKDSIDIISCTLDYIKENIFKKSLLYIFKVLEDNNFLTTLIEIGKDRNTKLDKTDKSNKNEKNKNIIKELKTKFLKEIKVDNEDEYKPKFLFNYKIPGFYNFYTNLSDYLNKDITAEFFNNEKKLRDYSKKKPDEQKNKFEEILTEKIMDAILEYNGESVTINCDYGPDILIYQAMEESGISTARTPFKTEMCINAFDVSVRNGYGAKQETLFDDTTDVDIQIVKDKYYEIYKAKKDFSKTLKLDNQK